MRVGGSLSGAFALGLANFLVVLSPAAAQVAARLDLSTSTRYVWHGVSRAAGATAQPSLAAGLRVGRLSLEGGAVRHYELDRIAGGELSEIGAGSRHLGEDDLWGRVALGVGPARLDGGVVRYLFHGDSTRGGLGTDRSTTELYAGVSVSGTYLNPTLEAWWDVDRVRGAYLQASVSEPILGWPFPPYVFTFLDGDIGLNLGQGPNASRPRDAANFADRGITHVGIGGEVQLRGGPGRGAGSLTFSVGWRTQINIDDATRSNGAARSKDIVVWAWTGVTLVLGGAAREPR
jgi:hypothetical protein